MKFIRFVVVVFLLGSPLVKAVEKQTSDADIYVIDKKSQSLRISWPAGKLSLKGVVGEKGEITRDLVDFDGKKALHYENLGVRSQFEAYVTLKRIGHDVYVDCIYGNIRSEQNGALINKAVCDINEKLIPDYENLIYRYSDAWKESVSALDISSLIQEPSNAASIKDGVFNDITVLRVYKSRDSLIDKLPVTVLQKDSLKHELGGDMVFTVYGKSDLNKVTRIEVPPKNLEGVFKRLDYESVNSLLH
ncbi:hypothetical protein [Pseudomonas viridiflava]|uniref:hypothetical protein n=2 Tax=Pseudomonas viridiflava TaxID=33069 RepID=UPI0018E5FA82|nr:hypothetical protein [Pseudomonas viridiflava]MBI6682078.1 hypothetical protein [Pseudomonas viridiflava]QXG47811.1 hypothetical protein KTT57_01720 [Pseudomonas viridiflava]